MASNSPAPNEDPRVSPIFTDLTRKQAESILTRNHIGRIAYTFHDRVDIEPIHYAYEDGWIYGRTSIGTKLSTIAHHRWVAFEVDEATGIFDWQSVVVHGAFYIIEPHAPNELNPVYSRGVELLSALVPETFTDKDPVSFRIVLFRIHADEIKGRRASSGKSTKK